MKSLLRSLTLIVSFALPFSTFAAAELAEGVVKKIDTPSQRVMLAHGPIANIGMGPMTMMFKVKEPAMLKKLKEGEKVRFRVEELGGDYTIVHIEVKK